jgi:hypothetical protein
MYKHEIQADIDAGKKVRRAGWPAGDYITKASSENIELTKEECENAGLDADAVITSAELFIYCSGKKSAIFGYAITAADNASQDWEHIIDKKKA